MVRCLAVPQTSSGIDGPSNTALDADEFWFCAGDHINGKECNRFPVIATSVSPGAVVHTRKYISPFGGNLDCGVSRCALCVRRLIRAASKVPHLTKLRRCRRDGAGQSVARDAATVASDGAGKCSAFSLSSGKYPARAGAKGFDEVEQAYIPAQVALDDVSLRRDDEI